MLRACTIIMLVWPPIGLSLATQHYATTENEYSFALIVVCSLFVLITYAALFLFGVWREVWGEPLLESDYVLYDQEKKDVAKLESGQYIILDDPDEPTQEYLDSQQDRDNERYIVIKAKSLPWRIKRKLREQINRK